MTKIRSVFLVMLLLCLMSSAAAARDPNVSRDLSWWTVGGGGGTLTEGAYSLSGTIGQADVGPALTDAGYTLVGGYWYGAAAPEWYDLHLPIVLRSY